jgi:hypothetical protein
MWHMVHLSQVFRGLLGIKYDEMADVHGSVLHDTNRIEITNKVRPCSRIYYSNVC